MQRKIALPILPKKSVLFISMGWEITHKWHMRWYLYVFTSLQIDKLWRTVMKATQSMQDTLPLTPHAGLCEWCVKTPFAPADIISSKVDGVNGLEYYQIHSRLQYGFLKSLLVSKPAIKVSMTTCTCLCFKHGVVPMAFFSL